MARRLEADIHDERRVVFDGMTSTDLDILTKILDQLDHNLRPALQ